MIKFREYAKKSVARGRGAKRHHISPVTPNFRYLFLGIYGMINRARAQALQQTDRCNELTRPLTIYNSRYYHSQRVPCNESLLRFYPLASYAVLSFSRSVSFHFPCSFSQTLPKLGQPSITHKHGHPYFFGAHLQSKTYSNEPCALAACAFL